MKNKVMAMKHRKARLEKTKACRKKAVDISAMEYRFGDWSAPVNGTSLYFKQEFYDKQTERETLAESFCLF